MQINAPPIETASSSELQALMLALVNNAEHITPALQNAIASFIEYQAAPQITLRDIYGHKAKKPIDWYKP